LIAGFFYQVLGQRLVVFSLFKRALSPFETKVIREVDAAHTTLPDNAADAVAPA
jgi:hypothetical protein